MRSTATLRARGPLASPPSALAAAAAGRVAAPPRCRDPHLARRGDSAAATRGPAVAARAAAGAGAAGGAGGGATPDPHAGGVEAAYAASSDRPALAFLQAFWKFLRPHTIRGTVLGTSMVVARALLEASSAGVALDWSLLPRALAGLAALLCGNGYIVGINQIYDVEIDAVNKPFLPVAAGELSARQAWALCAGLAAAGVALASAFYGRLTAGLYGAGLLLGTAYSVPPLRLKRHAVPAFLIIALVRGVLLNFGVYEATRAALGLAFAWSPAVLFVTAFVTVFATAIALTKDLPDVEGDRRYGVETFATRLGVGRLAGLAVALLLANYAGAVGLAVARPDLFRASVMGGAHVVLAALLVVEFWRLQASRFSRRAIVGFYRGVWNLFYAEYALLPFI